MSETVGTALVKLDISETILAEFKEQYAVEKLPDPSTKGGYNFLREGLSLLTSYRTGTETLRLAANQDHQDIIKSNNTLCKGYIEALKEIEAPMRELKREEDDRKEAIKREEEEKNQRRIAGITEKLEAIRNEPVKAIDLNSVEIRERIEELLKIDPDEGFDEFTGSAGTCIEKSIERLETLEEKAKLAEAQQLENEERDRIRAEEEEKTRLANEEAERVRLQGIADQEAENRRIAAELAEKERVLNERLAEAELNAPGETQPEDMVIPKEEATFEHIAPPDSFVPTMKIEMDDPADKFYENETANAINELMDKYDGKTYALHLVMCIKSNIIPNLHFNVEA